MLYLSVARGTPTVPGTSGKTTWWETNRSYQRPRMLRVAAMPVGVVWGKLHTPSITGGCKRGRAAELQPQVAREPGGGHHVHLLAHPHAVGRHQQIHGGLAGAVAACA